MARVLVTGAAGFVGRALLPALLRAGHRPLAAVRRLPDPRLPPEVEAVAVGDIDGATEWDTALDGVDCVVNLAARVHVMRERAADPLALFRRVNVEGSVRLADRAAARGVRRLVLLSTVKVHGEASIPGRPWRETDPTDAQDAYSRSKVEAEHALKDLSARTGMELVILRPPLVYGPGVGANFLRLMQWIDRGVPLPLAGVDNRRSLVAVDNLADAILACVGRSSAAGCTFLVSDGESLSTADLVRRMADALGRRPRLWRVPPLALRIAGTMAGRREEVERLLGFLEVDSGLIRRQLGWEPPQAMQDALRQTVAWYRNRLPGGD